jgi:hypothetical protein
LPKRYLYTAAREGVHTAQVIYRQLAVQSQIQKNVTQNFQKEWLSVQIEVCVQWRAEHGYWKH